jgi:hypothetical protein
VLITTKTLFQRPKRIGQIVPVPQPKLSLPKRGKR